MGQALTNDGPDALDAGQRPYRDWAARTERHACSRGSIGYLIVWLPDGRLRRQEPGGPVITHAKKLANEIVVDGHGTIHTNGADFNFSGGVGGECKSNARRDPTGSSPSHWDLACTNGRGS